MRVDAAGTLVYEGEEIVSATQLRKLAEAIDTPAATETATLVPWFGPTVAGEKQFVEALDLDLSRALLAGLSYEWVRPFVADESVAVRVLIAKVFDKGTNRFGVVVTEFSDKSGQLIHRQNATFIESIGA
ncbi:FAS1-like dehydratase domain-containing protein [Sporichthya polymorpha]|uniref:FAS1-like dehydratase domain-containing protein n=1 Tax=Sporichthya polymorpha TaxID=35751 RepID=UPI000364CBC8|nr:MaoC family dehydratase N-terminal domain-containing protein [Sporichthya polymorpha]